VTPPSSSNRKILEETRSVLESKIKNKTPLPYTLLGDTPPWKMSVEDLHKALDRDRQLTNSYLKEPQGWQEDFVNTLEEASLRDGLALPEEIQDYIKASDPLARYETSNSDLAKTVERQLLTLSHAPEPWKYENLTHQQRIALRTLESLQKYAKKEKLDINAATQEAVRNIHRQVGGENAQFLLKDMPNLLNKTKTGPVKTSPPVKFQPSPRPKEFAPLPEQPVAPPAKTEPTATRRSDPQRITKYKGYELRTKAPHIQVGRYMKGWDIYKDGKLVTSSDASLGEVKKKVDTFVESGQTQTSPPIADSLKAVASGKEPAFSNASRKTFEKLAGQKYATDKELARAVLEKMDDGELGPKLKRQPTKKKPTSSR
jgi:hypothetical protein